MPKRNSKNALKKEASSSSSSSPNKKGRKTLKPPSPSKFNKLDSEPRLHGKLSDSGYGTAIATKGPITGPRAFTRPAEQLICNPNNDTFNANHNIYGMVRIRNSRNSNSAKQMYWTTGKGESKNCDWKVSIQK